MGEEQYKGLKSSSFIRESQQVLKLTKNKKIEVYPYFRVVQR